MTHVADLPVWAALLVSFLLIAGSGLTLLGSLGLLRFRSFYERVHAPTLGTTWGAGGVLIASMVFFSIIHTRPVLHELLLSVFVTVTTPLSLMLLARAALYRDRTEKVDGVPPFDPADGDMLTAPPPVERDRDER